MSKVEDKARQKALERFPVLFGERMGYDKTNLQQERRNAYEKGYHQAEKDNELTWKDIKEICTQSVLVEIDLGGLVSDERHYTEVLKRFNKGRVDK